MIDALEPTNKSPILMISELKLIKTHQKRQNPRILTQASYKVMTEDVRYD